jgi:type II secretory pathway component PulK
VSELQLVKGFSSAIEEENDDYSLLLPHIAALPTTNGATAVNVNTATPEVIASLSEFLKPLAADLSRWDTGAYEDYPACEDIFDLDAEDAPATLEEERDVTPYESTLIFDDAAAPESGEEVAPPGSYDVKSRFYQVRIDVVTEDLGITQYTLFEREDSGKTKIIYRARDAL